jgi:Flp pilus assembly protein TadB
MKGWGFRAKGIVLLLGVMLITAPLINTSCTHEKTVSQRKIDKAKAKKDKEARKKYEQAVKQHQKNQSAATRSMMKQTKKASPGNTPLQPSSGKKCK